VIAAAIFAAYAAAASLLAPAALRGRRTAFAPRLVMSLWLALQASWVAAVVLAFGGGDDRRHVRRLP
jgi:hypothetical protein